MMLITGVLLTEVTDHTNSYIQEYSYSGDGGDSPHLEYIQRYFFQYVQYTESSQGSRSANSSGIDLQRSPVHSSPLSAQQSMRRYQMKDFRSEVSLYRGFFLQLPSY